MRKARASKVGNRSTAEDKARRTRASKLGAPSRRSRKPRLATRLDQVRRMLEQVEGERLRFESIGLQRLAEQKAREKRYWQFVLAVLELKPWSGQTTNRYTVH